MAKTKSVKTKPKRAAKPNSKRPGQKLIDGLNEALNDTKFREAFHRAHQRSREIISHEQGKRLARAEILAPTLKDMKRIGDDTEGELLILNSTDCRLLLACLAEAGYRPKDPMDLRNMLGAAALRTAGECDGSVPAVAKAA